MTAKFEIQVTLIWEIGTYMCMISSLHDHSHVQEHCLDMMLENGNKHDDGVMEKS